MRIFNESFTKYFVAVNDRAPDRPDLIEEKIDSFALLEKGWHFGEGLPAKQEVIENAKKVYRIGKACGIKGNVFPGLDGGITVTFYAAEENALEISIDVKCSFTLSHEVGLGFDYDQVDFQENVSIDDIKKKCRKIMAKKRPNLSGLSIHGYMIQAEEGSQATVSKILREMGGYQSSMPVVSSGNTVLRPACI